MYAPPAIADSEVQALQDSIRSLGNDVTYMAASIPGDARPMRARVRYATAIELANAIEQYALVVTFDARNFASGAPLKGDSVLIDGSRRGVMQVREIRGSNKLISYQLGVQG